MKKMEKGKSKLCSPSARSPKLERKIVEKNRRNRMKILYSNLISLLPDHGSKQEMPLPNQIGEVVTYIESLKMKVEKLKEKKQSLFPRKRSHSCITSEFQGNTQSSPPEVEVHDMGPNMDVILVSGIDDLSKFYSILRLLHENGVEVANANFSIHGNSTIIILHDKIGKSKMGLEVSTMSRRLMDLICGSTCSEIESNVDSEIQSDIWEFGFPDLIDIAYPSLEYLYQGYENM